MEISVPSLFIPNDDDADMFPPDPDTSNSNPDGMIIPITIANPYEIYADTLYITLILFHHDPISINSFFDNDNDYHYQSISIHHNHFFLITCIFIFCVLFFFFLFLF